MTQIAVKNPIAAMNLTAALKNNAAMNPIVVLKNNAAMNPIARNPIAVLKKIVQLKIAIILQVVRLVVDKIKVGILHAL